MPTKKRKTKRENHKSKTTGKRARKNDRKNNERSGTIEKQIDSARIYSRVDSNRLNFLDPLPSINPLILMLRQGVFFSGGNASEFIIKYYPTIRPFIQEHLNEYDWSEKTDPESFIEWMFEKLELITEPYRWKFNNNDFKIIKEISFIEEAYGITIGGFYQFKTMFPDLYEYVCRMIKLFLTNDNCMLNWKSYLFEGELESLEASLPEFDKGEKKEITDLIRNYESGDPQKFAIDIMSSKYISIDESYEIFKQLSIEPKGVKYTRKYHRFLKWIHNGIKISEDINVSNYFGHEELIKSEFANELEDAVSSFEQLSFIWSSNDRVFEWTDSSYSDRINNSWIAPICVELTYDEYINNSYPDFEKIKDWFTQGFNNFDYEPNKFKKSTFARTKHTLLCDIL